ncbi:hypothetical protein ES288_A13G085500v1 [Gossypium darwinii]|uniref:Uncharacterized protein n=1 Tax=Gossypium darwinii TaxID=34276 RepID=A0A5D2DXL6_GOSDA|nr:hypothetical protein ES288_A13G085500v1 [Gossypium darwinii]
MAFFFFSSQFSATAVSTDFFSDLTCILCRIVLTQVLREFNHVNPQTDEEGKVFLDTRTYVIFLAKLKKPQFSPGPESSECCLFELDNIPFFGIFSHFCYFEFVYRRC